MEGMKAFKRTLHAGKGKPIDFGKGTKAFFHYEAKVPRDDIKGYPPNPDDWVTIDDTRKPWPDGYGQEMELIFGKEFQLPIFETCLQSMLVDEICQFDVDPKELYPYPMVSKKLRDISKSKHKHDGHNHSDDHHEHHQCFGMASQHGTGYPVLDDLMKSPKPVRFIFHLIRVLQPNEYEAESWQLDGEQRLESVQTLKTAGNALFKEGKWSEALQKYREALTRLDSLLLREKPGDVEWIELDSQNVALYLNLSQCYLNLGSFYEAIETASEALKRDANNEKGLYRRAKGKIGAWDLASAKVDLTRLMELHPHAEQLAKKELAHISQLEKKKEAEDKACFGAMFSKTNQ
uniref:AIP/AIPL N-terminal FKBP-type PPIase domain-containing protein n=1 Tax=Plectus sambesii TaxID=2011161 RepID=A0A914WA67_9BILA